MKSHRTSVGWLGVLVVASFLTGVLVLNGVGLASVLTYAVYFGLVVLLPGTIVWSTLMERIEPESSRRTRLEDLVCGACMGYVIEIPSYAVARWLDVPRAYLLVPAAIVVAAVARQPWRRPVKDRPSWGTAPSLALGGVVAYALLWLGVRIMPSYELSPGGVYPDVDDAFQLALVGELRHHFPGVYPYVPDESLAYQIAYYLHGAGSTWVTGLRPIEVLARFDPVAFTVLAVLGAACVARRLTGRSWVGVVAAATLVLLGSYDVSGLFRGQANVEDRFLSGLLVHAPTQAMAFALAAPFVILAMQFLDEGRRVTRLGGLSFFVVCLVMTATKVTFAPMVVTGLLATGLLTMKRDRRLGLRAWGGATIATAGIGVCFALLYRGQSRGLSWDPLAVADHYGGFFEIEVGTFAGQLFVVASVLAGVLVPVAGVIGLLAHDVRRDPRVWFLLLTAASGLGAAILLAHSGLSQRYFLYSSAWVLAIASAWGLSALFPAGEPRSLYARYLGLAMLAGTGMLSLRLLAESKTVVRYLPNGVTEVKAGIPGSLDVPLLVLLVLVVLVVVRLTSRSWRVLVVVLVGLGLARALAFVIGNQPDDARSVAVRVPAAGVEAAEWLRDHSDPDDRVMTNAHCREIDRVGKCDNRHFWMSALSERRVLLEGWGYAGSAVWEPFATYVDDPALLEANDRVFLEPTEAELRAFVSEHDVRWLLVDRSAPVDLPRLTEALGHEPAFDRDGFIVFRAP